MAKRIALFHKYALIFGSLIVGSLLVSGLISMYFSYQENRAALINLQQEKANTAAQWIGHYLIDLERQIAYASPAKPGVDAIEQRRTELNVLRQLSVVDHIILLDASGHERLRTSRIGLDIIDSMQDWSMQDAFRQTKSGKPWRSPVRFLNESQPSMTIAMAIGPEQAGITVVQINLEFLLDGIHRTKIGKAGYSYVIDATGQLIAHPDLSLVMKNTNLSQLPQVQAARNGLRVSEQALNIQGQPMLVAWSPIPQLGWTVFVEQPMAEAFASLHTSLARTGVLLLIGLALSLLVSMILVRKIIVPIHALKEGAIRIGSSIGAEIDTGSSMATEPRRLRIEVKTGDELEDLAEQFNRMAGQLHDAYQNLEQKIAWRTSEVVQQKEKVELAHRHIALLSEIGRDITASLDRDDIMSSLYRHIHDLMEFDGFGIGICLPEQGLIEFPFAMRDDIRQPFYQRDLRDKNQLAVWCVVNRRELFINDREENIAHMVPGFDIESEMVRFKLTIDRVPNAAIYVPMLLKDRVLGVITVQHVKKNVYQRFHLDILRTLASYAAVALDNANAYEQLKSAQQQLVFQEKMVSLGTLTAGVAHEINNPANFAHVGAFNLKADLARFHEFLLQLAGDDADPEIVQSLQQRFDALALHLDTISEGTIRIRDLVKDLRTFSRLDEAETKEVAIADSLLSTVNLVRMQYAESTTIVCELDANPVLACWPAQLNQVFMNLIVNACQAIEKRNIEAPGPGILHIRSKLDAQWLILEFEDNGSGMSASTLAHVFEPFFTTKTVGEGMGMGLSISFGIIEKHRGKLEVRSTEGKGTCFSVKLPLAAAPGTESA
jgi:signal transduction histidine kinase